MADTFFSTPMKSERENSPAPSNVGGAFPVRSLRRPSPALGISFPAAPLVHTPTPVKDRFIAHRGSQDSSVSHFLLTTEDPVTPFLLSRQTTPQRGVGAAAAPSSGSAAGFTVSPSPARSLLFGGSATPHGSVASGLLGSSAGEPSPARTLASLFNSPSRFDAEVGTDAGMEEWEGDSSAVRHHSGAAVRDPSSPVSAPRSLQLPGSTKLVNIEPYNARLARTLFSDVPQTSVLCHSTSPAKSGRTAAPDSGLPRPVSPRPGPMSSSGLLGRKRGGADTSSPERVLRCEGSQHNSFRSPYRADSVSAEGDARAAPPPPPPHSAPLARVESGGTTVLRRLELDLLDDDPHSLQNTVTSLSSTGVRSNGMGGSSAALRLQLDDDSDDAWNSTQRSEAEHFEQRPAVVFERNKAKNFVSKGFRHISSTPDHILDATNLVDEFYYNVLDCSCFNMVAVALQTSVYLWEWSTEKILTLPNESVNVSGVKWCPDGVRLAHSNEEGDVVIWDVQHQVENTVFTVHQQRVCSLSWNATGNILASGSKDTSIILNDTRSKAPALRLASHEKEVCGLQWSLHDLYLASGGDDNQLLVWDSRRLDKPLHTHTEHVSAVKALAWNPVQPHLLASAGGIEDKTIRFWSEDTGECVKEVHTHSQVSGAVWNHAGTELATCHGFPMNQITLWKYPSMSKVTDLCGHRDRVLHLCLSADGGTVVSAASDQTVRFWSCFPSSSAPAGSPP